MVHTTHQRSGVVVAAEPGPTNLKIPAQYGNGPVHMLAHKHTFAHSRVQQGSHTTMFLRAWCPGLYGASPAQGNHTAFLSELDERLKSSHTTLAAVQRRSRAVVHQALDSTLGWQKQQQQQQQQQQDHYHYHQQPQIEHCNPFRQDQQQPQHFPYSGPYTPEPSSHWQQHCQVQPCSSSQQQQPQQQQWGSLQGATSSFQPPPSFRAHQTQEPNYADLDTAAMRNTVNASLATQLDFFGGCMARWAKDTRQPPCKCVGCDCVCALADARVRGRAYEGAYSSL